MISKKEFFTARQSNLYGEINDMIKELDIVPRAKDTVHTAQSLCVE